MITSILSRFWKQITIAFAGLIGIVAVYLKGRGDGVRVEKVKEQKAEIDVQKKINEMERRDFENQRKNKSIANDIVRSPDAGFVDDNKLLD